MREITEQEKKKFEENTKGDKSKLQFMNYYDDQRFGIKKDNHIIGKLFIKKQFKEAATLFITRDHYPYTKAKKYLETHLNDYIGTLRILPRKLLLMFVHAYQSWLWN